MQLTRHLSVSFSIYTPPPPPTHPKWFIVIIIIIVILYFISHLAHRMLWQHYSQSYIAHAPDGSDVFIMNGVTAAHQRGQRRQVAKHKLQVFTHHSHWSQQLTKGKSRVINVKPYGTASFISLPSKKWVHLKTVPRKSTDMFIMWHTIQNG